MDSIPPELVGLIVEEIPDDGSLHACCLAASRFREPCQRRILARLQLQTTSDSDANQDWDNMRWILSKDAAAHLDEFPHLAAYVSDCWIALDRGDAFSTSLHPLAANEDTTHAVSVLRRLKNVRQASILGIGLTTWPDIPNELTAAVLGVIDLVLHRKLGGRLTIHVDNFPLAPLRRILACASAVWLDDDIPVDEDELAIDAELVAPAADEASLKVLYLGASPSVKNLLLHPAFTPFIRSLKKLDLTLDLRDHIVSAFAICFPCAQTLERLHIQFFGFIGLPDIDSDLPSQLPNLRELQLEFRPLPGDISTVWHLPAFLADLLTRPVTPLLSQLHIRLSLKLVPSTNMAYTLPSSSQSLDDVLGRRLIAGTKVYITPNFWLSYEDHRRSSALIATHFEAFSVAFRDGLPKSVAKGLCILQWDGSKEHF
ncbi:hypothetical protein C8F01DRAFT_1379602 [Mycena amicta]|nr:hypothetical protein C8F01DRAFT_1379602 [Mycena amicta]